MDASLLLAGLLLIQASGDGWALVHDTGAVKRLYWDLFETTEVWLRLIPEDPEGKPPLVNLVFQAFFPGRAERDPGTGLPQWPRGRPARLLLKALPLPTTVVGELSLRLVIDAASVDLAGPAAPHRLLYPYCPDGCAANGVEIDLEPSLLRSLIGARAVQGEALGFPFRLTANDQRALKEFSTRTGLTGE
jgi:hypothetical protein